MTEGFRTFERNISLSKEKVKMFFSLFNHEVKFWTTGLSSEVNVGRLKAMIFMMTREWLLMERNSGSQDERHARRHF
jgi:hypothetical protein